MIQFLHPDLALERACDIGRGGHCTPDHPRTMKIVVPMAPVPSEAEHAERSCRAAWWEVHYWGRPTREKERDLALMRAVAYLPIDATSGDGVPYSRDALAFVKRSIRPGKKAA